MKKIIATLMAGLMAVSVLAGCGGSTGTDSKTSDVNAGKTESDWSYIADKGEMVIGTIWMITVS